MIAIDASSFRRYLDGIDALDTRKVVQAVTAGEACFPPAALAELLSDPQLVSEQLGEILTLSVLPLRSGYWHRAGYLRAALLSRKLKAELPDTLIAQSCIDHAIPLITYDDDFRHFVRAGLQLL